MRYRACANWSTWAVRQSQFACCLAMPIRPMNGALVISPVSTSRISQFLFLSSLLPQWREYERASTTVADAFIKPHMSHYFSRLATELCGQGLKTDLLVMKSNSGLMTAHSASREPIHTFLSGPAGGALAGKFIGASAGYNNLITMDMGGTSFDVSLVRRGKIAERTEATLGDGLPIQMSMIDIRTIGAGGGSVGWVDRGGVVKVGPRSAGAIPGPACYGRGGVEPTITDANLILGRLSKFGLLGGDLTLDVARSNAAIDRLVKSLGIDRTKVANGMITICVNNMVNEVRAISAQQGLDPREFALIAAGGAAPSCNSHSRCPWDRYRHCSALSRPAQCCGAAARGSEIRYRQVVAILARALQSSGFGRSASRHGQTGRGYFAIGGVQRRSGGAPKSRYAISRAKLGDRCPNSRWWTLNRISSRCI